MALPASPLLAIPFHHTPVLVSTVLQALCKQRIERQSVSNKISHFPQKKTKNKKQKNKTQTGFVFPFLSRRNFA